MASQEHPRDRAQRYLAMAETTPDPHIANGLRLLAAAYLEMAAKEGDQQQEAVEIKQSENSPD
ncbi:MAG: hypothetical protein JO134_03100 [Xanthobacteraceae bacterium]|nr:hypothetical protein [Xanthobacteraceae bacterium]